MRITLESGRELRLIFNRDPHPLTKKNRRKHRATRVVVVEDHGTYSHILARAQVRCYPPDQFTREGGRSEALAKALHEAWLTKALPLDEAMEVTRLYDNRPRYRPEPTCAELARDAERRVLTPQHDVKYTSIVASLRAAYHRA